MASQKATLSVDRNYGDGYQAGRAGLAKTANPHKEGEAATRWSAGWEDGAAVRSWLLSAAAKGKVGRREG